MMLAPILGLVLNLSLFGLFVPGSTYFLQGFGGYGGNRENELFGWYVQEIYREAS